VLRQTLRIHRAEMEAATQPEAKGKEERYRLVLEAPTTEFGTGIVLQTKFIVMTAPGNWM